jgi:hypothetical protein
MHAPLHHTKTRPRATISYTALGKRPSIKLKATVVIAPPTLLGQWRDEFRKFAPSLKVYCLHKAAGGVRGSQFYTSFQSHGSRCMPKLRFPFMDSVRKMRGVSQPIAPRCAGPLFAFFLKILAVDLASMARCKC